VESVNSCDAPSSVRNLGCPVGGPLRCYVPLEQYGKKVKGYWNVTRCGLADKCRCSVTTAAPIFRVKACAGQEKLDIMRSGRQVRVHPTEIGMQVRVAATVSE
jgi:hypothetical protein